MRWLLALALLHAAHAANQGYYGKFIGKLSQLHHGVSGDVYAVDARTLHIRDFTYDGEGPAAWFYAGNSKNPSSSTGFKVPDERGTLNVLRRYRGEHITLTLPDNKTLRDIKWISVYCDQYSVNFGDVKINKNLDFPKPQKIDGLSPHAGGHLVSSDNIVIVDAQTLLVPNFSYDGEAPDAKFWVGPGPKPSSQGIRVPDENGKEVPLRRYDRKTIVLTLPGALTVQDIGHFGVWCEAFAVDFGHVRVPRPLNVPPSLKMLNVSAQSKLNCEVLQDDFAFEVRWAVAGDSVVIQLVGKVADGEYMSFGLSGDDQHSRMIGGDVVVAYVDHNTLAGSAQDYFLDSKSQCAGTTGSCPDTRIRENTNSVRLLNAALVNGYSIVTFQRSLHAQDELDLPIFTNGSQPIIWALGPLNSRKETSYHTYFNKKDIFIDFGRPPQWNCPIPDSDNTISTTLAPVTHRTRTTKPVQRTDEPTEEDEQQQFTKQQQSSASSRRQVSRAPATPAPASKEDAWQIPPIQCYEPEDGVFYAQMGPTGGKRGYPAITGHVGWGISWYINGLLIPEINVIRGKTYTFVVEGGNDPEVPAQYHPFYITDDPVGGYMHKTAKEKAEVRVFAGVRKNRRGEDYPTGVGRLCSWTPDPNQPLADEFASFGAYQRTLTLECNTGEPGVIEWTPDEDTPDTVYYQCYSHRYLGWKINVLDSCDAAASASNSVPVRIPVQRIPEEDLEDGELQGRPSIRVTTRVKPSDDFSLHGKKGTNQQEKDYVFKESQKLPSNLKNNFQQDFSIYSSKLKKPEEQLDDAIHFQDTHVPPSKVTEDFAYFVPKPQKDGPIQADQSLTSDNKPLNSTQHTTEILSSKNNTPEALPLTSTSTFLQAGNAGTGLQFTDAHLSNQESIAGSVIVTEESVNKEQLQPEFQPEQVTNQTSLLINSQDSKSESESAVKLHQPDIPSLRKPLTHQSLNKPPMSYVLPNPRIPLHPAVMLHHPALYRRPIPFRGFPNLQRPGVLRHPYLSTMMPHSILISGKKPLFRIPMVSTHPGPYPRPVTAFPLLARSSPVMLHVDHQKQTIPLNQPEDLSLSLRSTTPLPQYDISTSDSETDSMAIHTVPEHTADESISIPVAVNTGFHPESVIVEGGFKPIIKNIAAEERSSFGHLDDSAPGNVGSSALEKLQDEILFNEEEEKKDNPFEGQQPEQFEPMFIPSPPDRIMLLQNNTENLPIKKNSVLSTSVNHNRSNIQLKRKPSHQYISFRQRPHISRRSQPSDITHIRNSPSKIRSINSDEIIDEIPMAAERKDIYYLPPVDHSTVKYRVHSAPAVDLKVPKGSIVTYDGKPVTDVSLASSIVNPSVGASPLYRSAPSALLQATPQFGPFRGEIPPPVPPVPPADSISQVSSITQGRAFPLPEQISQVNPRDKHVSAIIKRVEHAEKQIQDSFPHTQDLKGQVSATGTTKVRAQINEDSSSQHRQYKEFRSKRAAHHEPGHVEEQDPHHDHSHHMHAEKEKMNNSSSSFLPSNIIIISVMSILLSVWL